MATLSSQPRPSPSSSEYLFLKELIVEGKLSSRPFSWERLVDEALLNGLHCLLLAKIRELRLSAPAEAVERLRGLCAASVQRNARLLEVWRSVRMGTPIKGLWLIKNGFYQLWERPLSDADLLVDDLEEALREFSKRGFRLHARTKTGAVVFDGELPFDLHTTPFPPELRVPRLKGLTPEHQALIVAVHLYKSALSWGPRLVWLLDLKRLSGRVDPGALWRLAGSLGLRGALSGALHPHRLPKGSGYWAKAMASAKAGWAFWLRAAFYFSP